LKRNPNFKYRFAGLLTGTWIATPSADAIMDPLSISAASGMKARMEALDLLANNIANASTAGFKLDRENYNIFTAENFGIDDTTESPVIEKNWTDFAQGNLVQTGNHLDFALEGRGFFVVDGPNGPLLTRNGGFRLSPSGKLETAEGYAVRVNTSDGQPYKLDPLAAIEVSREGLITQRSAAVGQLATADVASQEDIAKIGGVYFQVRNPVSKLASAAGAVRQEYLESANVVPSENAVRLVGILRQYEALQKAISIGTDMNRKAIEEVARVS
jgi:flagellar basal body rod protein FlgG